MSSDLVMAIDIGSTGTKVICVDASGSIVASANTTIDSFSPRDGWVEHDPIQLWDSVVNCLGEIRNDVSSSRVAAVGITNQRETTVIWDRKTGSPVYNAISWQCKRSADICRRYAHLEAEIEKKTGSLLDAYYSATKIVWLFENVADVRERALKGELLFGTVDSWIIWKLTNGASHKTDSSNASRTLLFNIITNQWDDALLKEFDIPEKILPAVGDSDSLFGEAVAPAEFFVKPIPIMSCLGDQQSALFGQTCFEEKEAKCTFGTCLNLGINTGKIIRSEARGLTPTIAWRTGGEMTYKVEGGVYVAGSLLNWLVKKARLASSVSELTDLAQSVDSAEGIAFVPAFVGLAAPHWDMTARGILAGLSFNHDVAHISRAALESVAFQTYDVLRTAREGLGISVQKLNVDGGMAKNDFLMQLVSDICSCSLDRAEYLESTSMGAAYLAGVSTGFWKDYSEVKRLRKTERVFEPQLSESRRENMISVWNRAVERSKGWSQ